MPELPTGTVTFLFTDVEGSTRLLQRMGDAYPDLLATHNRILRDAIAAGGGFEVQTEGDAFFAVFPTPAGALRATVQAQTVLSSHSWPEGNIVRVRMGVHTGEGVVRGGTYVGLDVHRAARIVAAGHGGQVLVSDATRALVEHILPAGVDLRDLGRHRLKDIEQPERLHQVVIESLPNAFPPIRTLDARLTNIPPERTSFVGRGHEVGEITALLERIRLLTLTGPGGIGKTRLALRIAAAQLGRFADGVYLVDLSRITDPGLVPASIATALMVREQPGRDILDSLVDHLRDRELLLILDNVEQVVEAASAVSRLVDAAPRLTVLSTSRVPLHISGEQEFAVPPLALPNPVHGSGHASVDGNEAVTLFIERAAAVRPGMRLTADNAPIIAQIALKLDGLPLAIELAASRTKVLTPDAILARLGTRLALLTGGAGDRPERQRTLRSTIEWSHDLLRAEEQHLFARLGTFSGGCTLETAELICGPDLDLNVFDGLTTLVDHSLVRAGGRGNGDARFTMLETIREFAIERLASSGDEGEILSRYAEYFRDLAEEAERHLMRDDRVTWLARLEDEHENLRAVLDWAEQAGDAHTGLRTAAAVWRFWLQRGHLSEGRGRLERLLAMPDVDIAGPVRVRALAAIGGLAYWQNDPALTRAAYEEAVEIAQALSDSKLLASALYDLSFVPYMEGNPEGAQPILREGMAIAEKSGDRVLLARFLNSIAFLDVDRGNPGAAIEPFRTAIAILLDEGAAWNAADLLIGLGYITRMAGDLDAAKRHFSEALQTFAEAGDALMISTVINGLALAANDEGLHGRAARLLGAAARMRNEVGGAGPLIGRWGDPENDARTALGQDAYDTARAEGYTMETETAVAYAKGSGN
ncbi:MAG TPA: adenylate/guanylate cyclase domain-containing protein [Candidatus Limnocylindria bacterium]|nr:adenylate/guanylate cyclase domain-containing protein [Candidatus Limnocylindria bacterium]